MKWIKYGVTLLVAAGTDIRNTKAINVVILRGELLDRALLDDMLVAV